MRFANRWPAFAGVVLVVLLVSVGFLLNASEPPPTVEDTLEGLRGLSLEAFFEASFRALILRDPELVTAHGLADYLGIRNDRLTDISVSHTEDTMALEAGILGILESYDRETLLEPMRTYYDVYAWYLDDLVRGHPYRYHEYLLNGFLTFNVPGWIEYLFSSSHPLQDRDDVEDYLARLAEVPLKTQQLIAGVHHRCSLGIETPGFVLRSTKTKIDTMIGLSGPSVRDPSRIPGTRPPAYQRFAADLEEIAGTSPAQKEAYLIEAETRFAEDFIAPLWEVRGLIDQLLRSPIAEGGATTFPDGEAFFAYCLRHETTTDLTPDEVHQYGLREAERILGEMRDQFAEMGFPRDAPLVELWEMAREQETYYDGRTDAGQATVFAYLEDLYDRTEDTCAPYFNLWPSQRATLIPGPPDAYVNFYDSPAWDGSRPGAFNVAVSNWVGESRLMVVFHHEAIPGHHTQLTVALEQDLPLFMRFFQYNGLVEGWALYCERLMYDLGMYEGKPLENLARLDLELIRAARLVIDTGIHAYGWTRQEAAAYVEDLRGDPRGSFLGAIERYTVLPGQASSYMVGKLVIERLRDEARAALGDAFDLAAFHDVVLGAGGVPLETLEARVDRYIEGAGGR